MENRMEITTEILTKAMKEAVKLGIFPKHASQEDYIKHWYAMKKLLETVSEDFFDEEEYKKYTIMQLKQKANNNI